MTGYNSIDDDSPESIALIALAAFSTSYNLPVYLRYNLTYRRAFLRMLRCQGPQVSTSPTVSTIRSVATVINTGRNRTTAAGDGGQRVTSAGLELHETSEPQRQPVKMSHEQSLDVWVRKRMYTRMTLSRVVVRPVMLINGRQSVLCRKLQRNIKLK